MAYSFENAKVLDYSIKRDFLGEGVAVLKTVKSLEIEGFFDARKLNLDAQGVKENINAFQNKLLSLIGQYDSVIINGYDLGSGRILNISFPKENPILFGEYKYNIEIVENCNFSNFPQDDKYGSALSIVADKIENLSENFDFKYGLDNYEYSYELELQYYPNGEDLLLKSKNLATTLFNENLNLFLLKNDPLFYNNLKSEDHIFDETYDLIKKKCKFSKRLKINKNFNFIKNYSISKNYNLMFSENGGVTVKEEGEIVFLKNFSEIVNLEDTINSEINNSYQNCQSFFLAYVTKYNLGDFENLKENPVQIGKDKDIFNKKVKYNVVYVNHTAFLSTNRYLNYTSTTDTNSLGIKNKTESGEIILVRLLENSENINSNFSAINYFDNRKSLAENEDFKVIGSDISLEIYENKYGNKLSYNIASTTDPSIKKNGIINKQNIDISETPYLKEIIEYPIPANPTGRVILSNLLGEPLKSKKIEINAVLKRNLSPSQYFYYFKNLAWTNIGGLNSSSFISEAEYSYDHLNNIGLTLAIQNG